MKNKYTSKSPLKGKILPVRQNQRKSSSFFLPMIQTHDTGNRTIEQTISSTGFSLPAETKQFFEPKFNYSFDQVKIHTGNTAARSADKLNANAYTYRNHIVFNSGKYNQTTREGKKLLAHELSHVKLHAHNEGIFRSPADKPEASEEEQQQAIASSPATQSNCTPVGMDRKNFLSQPNVKQDMFGLTVLDTSLVTYPQINLLKSGSKYILQNTVSNLPTMPSVFTKDGLFIEGKVHFMGQSPCHPGVAKTYPALWEITPDAATLISDAEAEHCADYNYAFAISLQVFTDAVNDFANAKTKFNNMAHCKRELFKKTKVKPDDWNGYFRGLALKSLDRDKAPNKWHDPKYRTINPDKITSPIQYWCNYVKLLIHKGSLPEVNKHPSSSIIP